MSKCWLEKHPKYKSCCCICKYQLRAFDNENPSEQIGWACIAFAFEEGEAIAYIGDFEHGLCELYAPHKEREPSSV